MTKFDIRRQERFERERKLRMAKQHVHVGISVATDSGAKPDLPGRANIISLAACVGEVGKFTVNVLPPKYGESPYWTKHPSEYEELKKNPVSLRDAMTQFRLWLKKFQGTMIACTSSLDFWHLTHALFETGRDNPFGPIPLDTHSYAAGLEARKIPRRLQVGVRPSDVALERWNLVTRGALPVFGKPEKKAAPPKLFRAAPPTWQRQARQTVLGTNAVPPPTLRTWEIADAAAAIDQIQNELIDNAFLREIQ